MRLANQTQQERVIHATLGFTYHDGIARGLQIARNVTPIGSPAAIDIQRALDRSMSRRERLTRAALNPNKKARTQ